MYIKEAIEFLEELKEGGSVKYIEHKMLPWEIGHGQFYIKVKDYPIFKKLFNNYLKKGFNFNLETFLGNFKNKHFKDYPREQVIRLACKPFFSKLKPGGMIYIQPSNRDTIKISKKKPVAYDKELDDVIKWLKSIDKIERGDKR